MNKTKRIFVQLFFATSFLSSLSLYGHPPDATSAAVDPAWPCSIQNSVDPTFSQEIPAHDLFSCIDSSIEEVLRIGKEGDTFTFQYLSLEAQYSGKISLDSQSIDSSECRLGWQEEKKGASYVSPSQKTTRIHDHTDCWILLFSEITLIGLEEPIPTRATAEFVSKDYKVSLVVRALQSLH